MATDTRVWPDIAIPPGELLAETLETLGISQAELARRAGRPPQAINEIVRGAKEITPETALQFERVLGVPAHVWTRLEADYRYTKARLDDQARLTAEIPLSRKYPYTAMAKHGWVSRVRNPRDRVNELLRFFGVASLRNVPNAESAAFRRSRLRASSEALAAWLRQGERQAHQMVTGGFNEQGVRAALAELRALTMLDPQEFEPRLKKILAERGVALLLVPHLPKTGAQGATRWLGPDKALVQMSIRYKWDDTFWFSLFHELGHLLLHGRGTIFIERTHDGNGEPEQQADAFARDYLLPPTDYAAFVQRADWSRVAIRAFAREQGIAPSVVVGRLQHDGHIPHSNLNDLRSRFMWVGAPNT